MTRTSQFSIRGPSTGNGDICGPVLDALPNWFGIQEANIHYLKAIDENPTFIALDGKLVIGFLTLK
ncbi:hypothetical protein ACFLXI_03290 [Chloroflexota bacterium]